MTHGARRESYCRRHRLAGRGLFLAILRSPRMQRSDAMVLRVATGREGESRLGVVIGKRLARRSVDRNRLKRLVRETFRRHDVKTAGLDLVLVPRKPFRRDGETAWMAQLRELLDHAAGH